MDSENGLIMTSRHTKRLFFLNRTDVVICLERISRVLGGIAYIRGERKYDLPAEKMQEKVQRNKESHYEHTARDSLVRGVKRTSVCMNAVH
jgi:hypothetical protein